MPQENKNRPESYAFHYKMALRSKVLNSAMPLSSSLASCGRDAYLAWPHILMAVNDFGIIKLDPFIIKAVCFPRIESVTVADIQIWLKIYSTNQWEEYKDEEGNSWGYIRNYKKFNQRYCKPLSEWRGPMPPKQQSAEVKRFLNPVKKIEAVKEPEQKKETLEEIAERIGKNMKRIN